MQKQRIYTSTNFDSKTLFEATQKFDAMAKNKPKYLALKVTLKDAVWSYDTLDEFLAAADQGRASLTVTDHEEHALFVNPKEGTTEIAVKASTRQEIESIFAIFDKNAERCHEQLDEPGIRIFIGHGQNPQWRDLKDHLHEKHDYAIEAYEIGARAGHTIRDILEKMLEESSFALLVMTGEDEDKDGTLHARDNVIHEAGLFQGNLGFTRAIILLEESTHEFSNIHGLQQIRFAKGNIKETFGEVLAVLKREFWKKRIKRMLLCLPTIGS